jgi:hypothetical protein
MGRLVKYPGAIAHLEVESRLPDYKPNDEDMEDDEKDEEELEREEDESEEDDPKDYEPKSIVSKKPSPTSPKGP